MSVRPYYWAQLKGWLQLPTIANKVQACCLCQNSSGSDMNKSWGGFEPAITGYIERTKTIIQHFKLLSEDLPFCLAMLEPSTLQIPMLICGFSRGFGQSLQLRLEGFCRRFWISMSCTYGFSSRFGTPYSYYFVAFLADSDNPCDCVLISFYWPFLGEVGRVIFFQIRYSLYVTFLWLFSPILNILATSFWWLLLTTLNIHEAALCGISY